ncbi:MAG: hypothetical protein MSC31_18750 [Solirubrobacteraceae bacterium MAG38_C4-C5]|nr:hypothetical protein [Candidatus Siliceabacter maunaloa]
MRASKATDFAGGEDERAHTLAQTERDYVAIVEAGAEAARLEAELASADREASARDVDTATLVIGDRT